MSEKPKNQSTPNSAPEPGEGLRSLKTSGVFRAVNFELYVKQNKAVMAIGLLAFSISVGYIAYMRSKYESLGYVTVVDSSGKEITRPKESRWEV